MPSSMHPAGPPKILVPLDNAPQSAAAARFAAQIARHWKASLTGAHVYSARLHDYRFRQMEVTLPAKYQEEEELERQRRVHDKIIEEGLRLISESYLNAAAAQAESQGVAFDPLLLEGKHHRRLREHINEAFYRLVVLGAQGMGSVAGATLGSVAERVFQHCTVDAVILRDLHFENAPGPIAVGIDGSPHSYGALKLALELGACFDRPVTALSVYDPFLHYTVFSAMVDVLSRRAARMFRLENQQEFHEKIIDQGLARLYENHLAIARAVAAETGQVIETELLAGKAWDQLAAWCARHQPFLLLLGRVGLHTTGEEGADEPGATALALARTAPCNVWLTVNRHVPTLDDRARESMAWSLPAMKRMEGLPPEARRVAVTAVLRHAWLQGNSVITPAIIDAAIERFMPDGILRTMGLAAREVALERVRDGSLILRQCPRCGWVSTGAAASCPACGGLEAPRPVDAGCLDVLYGPGPVKESPPLPEWSPEALARLNDFPDAYERRLLQNRAESHAVKMGLALITGDLFNQMITSTPNTSGQPLSET